MNFNNALMLLVIRGLCFTASPTGDVPRWVTCNTASYLTW